MNISRPMVIAGASVLSFVVGSVAGYLLAKKQMQVDFQNRVDAEVEEAKRYYRFIYKRDEFQTPESAAQSLGVFDEVVDAMLRYQGRASVDENTQEIEPVIEIRNVFERQTEADRVYSYDPEDYASEVANRDENRPYVISQEEFFEADKGYGQLSITWYEGDKVLADEEDKPIDLVDKTVGEENMDRFGHFSNDPTLVYIRNDNLQVDFEVTHREGTYLQEVLGFDANETIRVPARHPDPEIVRARDRFASKPVRSDSG